METNFGCLAKYFKECFPADQFTFGSDERTWIYAAPTGLTPDNSIHYELIQRSSSLFFIEFHIEGNQHKNYVRQAYKCFDANLRRFHSFTYYSSKYWQTRTPVFTPQDIEHDVKELRGLVSNISSKAQDDAAPEEENTDLLCGSNHSTISPRKIAIYLQNNTLTIPNIQRGLVWNVARIGTLWDSMLRNFPIGSFSVQENQGRWELLDGQQRSHAISLGFGDFSNPKQDQDKRKKPILWLECAPEESHNNQGEKVFIFYVTTCAHPWGYRLSEDEMRNSTLTAEEKRRAVSGVDGHPKNAGKPYPDELYPYFSKMPVPVSLLTEWLSPEKKHQPRNWKDFCEWCLNKMQGQNWRWIEKIGNENPTDDYWEKICNAFIALDQYEIFLNSAANVDAENIALYFTRIGRGGVVPSDEELAYSVLKSKIGNNFRETIEKISENGMAPSARIAHLAIRCFATGQHEFYCGSILEQANRIVRGQREQFIAFMKDFPLLTEKTNNAMGAFLPWHKSRYCTYSNGDIYLFLLLTAQESENDLPKAIGIAEYVHCFANNVRMTLQIIRRNGMREGLLEALRTSRYRTPILEFPISPEEYPSPSTMDELQNWWNDSQHHPAVELLKRGYGNHKAYSMLLFACGRAISQSDYDPYLAEWSDESCPWDYDHILPRNWFDKIGKTEEAFFCSELKNSIGNLAPLPFSLNRSLSDNERTECYPCSSDSEETRRIQQQLCIDRAKIAHKGFCDSSDKGKPEQEKFCLATLARFKEIYSRWFNVVGLQQILAEHEKSKRQAIFEVLSEKIAGSQIYYVDGDRQYPFSNELDWYRTWLAVGVNTERDFIAVASNGFRIQVGLRRQPQNTNIDGQNIWYRKNNCKEYNFDDDGLVDKLMQKLEELVKQSIPTSKS